MIYCREVPDKSKGAEEKPKGIWNVYFRNVFLAYFDEKLIKKKDTYFIFII